MKFCYLLIIFFKKGELSPFEIWLTQWQKRL